MAQRRKKKAAPHIGADFSRTCEGCANIITEQAEKGKPWHRCNAPGPCKGYVVSHAGRFLPYVPAWCPLMDAGEGGSQK